MRPQRKHPGGGAGCRSAGRALEAPRRFGAHRGKFLLSCLHENASQLFNKCAKKMRRSFYAGIDSFFTLIKLLSVGRLTPTRRIISVFESPLEIMPRTASSRPLSFSDYPSLGLPSANPSARLLARASFVRIEIRLRSISAESPNANASTLEFMLSPSS